LELNCQGKENAYLYTPLKSLAPSNVFYYVFGAMGKYLAYLIFQLAHGSIEGFCHTSFE
jgi:hypothetical protein